MILNNIEFLSQFVNHPNPQPEGPGDFISGFASSRIRRYGRTKQFEQEMKGNGFSRLISGDYLQDLLKLS